MIPLWTIPLATVTGNTLILKPSERDPGAAMMIAELCERAGNASSSYHTPTSLILLIGLPPGVLNIVHGSVATVNAICDHPDIKAVSFVGGDKAGKHIYQRFVLLEPLFRSFTDKTCRARQSGKRVQCNMGAKNHAVIMPDGKFSIDMIVLLTYLRSQPMLTIR